MEYKKESCRKEKVYSVLLYTMEYLHEIMLVEDIWPLIWRVEFKENEI